MTLLCLRQHIARHLYVKQKIIFMETIKIKRSYEKIRKKYNTLQKQSNILFFVSNHEYPGADRVIYR